MICNFCAIRSLTVLKFRQLIVVLASFLGMLVGFEADAGMYLLVNGQASNNVVQFNLATGEATLFAEYPDGTSPRNLVVREDGAVFSSMLSGTRNVVQLVEQPGSNVRQAVSFTPSVGGLGTGQLAFTKTIFLWQGIVLEASFNTTVRQVQRLVALV